MWIPSINEYSSGFLSLFFPEHCLICEKRLFDFEDHLCVKCRIELPLAHHRKGIVDNPIADLLRPRFPLTSAFSLLEFNKGNSVQKLLHAIKYQDNPALAEWLGRMIAEYLLTYTDTHFSADVLVPVPLHPKKRRKRGFNQSERIAKGISDILKIPLDCETLIRISNSRSQTSLGRNERWRNIDGAFTCSDKKLSGVRVALVDDMVTTGSTLEACSNALEAQEISVLSLAFEP